MAQQYLCSVRIENNEEIAAHPEATHYSIRGKKVLFHRVNPLPTKKMREIPRNVNTMRFPNYREHRNSLGGGWVEYGKPEFRGHCIRQGISKLLSLNLILGLALLLL